MFETDQYDKHLRTQSGAELQSYQYTTDIEYMSLLLWGEHCIECAAPDCFQTCALYQARPDMRCRRFEFGMFKNSAYPSMRSYGTELVFKKWAKLETRGDTCMLPMSFLLRFEQFYRILAPILNFSGSIINRFTKDVRFNSLTHALFDRLIRRLHSEESGRRLPDGFLLELYNPGFQDIKIQLTMSIAYYSLPQSVASLSKRIPPFSTTLSIGPGYSKYAFDRALFQAITSPGLPFDIALTPEANSSAKLILLTADFVKYHKQRQPQTKIKCVVWDLDNTLWQGILLENPDVKLHPDIVRLIKHLDKCGILNSIASKNTHEHALEKLQALGLADYFLVPHINWKPKSENIKSIANQLNIGLDTFAFVDDNPFELEEVSTVLPMVECVKIDDIDLMFTDPAYEGSRTSDAKNRRAFYKDAVRREIIQQDFGDNYISFLQSCEIQLYIQTYEDSNRERVEELVQRTNQLNFSGRKYKINEIQSLLENDEYKKSVLQCSDKYGDYGIVGFSLVKESGDELCIDDFMLSCRVQGKFIEKAFFAHLIKDHNSGHKKFLCVNYKETDRNKPARLVLEALKFEKSDQKDDFMLDISRNELECQFINVTCKICA